MVAKRIHQIIFSYFNEEAGMMENTVIIISSGRTSRHTWPADSPATTTNCWSRENYYNKIRRTLWALEQRVSKESSQWDH